MQQQKKGEHTIERGSFRADIEGLRGLAVLLVVLFHSGVPSFRGGFIGVDVFFALSGYLITGLIVKEVERSGRLSFLNFYARRVRRLLPASGLVAVSILLLALLFYSPLELVRYAKWASYTSLYITNLMFMREAANYFASDVALNPYLHTWSLAVEEQFYLFWPALIVVSLLLLKSRRGLAAVLLAICIGSFGICVWLTYVHPIWAFFSLPTRAWEFALGALACLLPKQFLATRARCMRILGWTGLVAILASACAFYPEIKFPGFSAMLPIAGTVAALIAGASGVPSALQSFLGSKPLQYLGRLSYSWYLWHWPILLLADACCPHLAWWQRLLPAAVSLALSHITFHLLEKPVRFNAFLLPRPAWSLSIALLVAALSLSTATLVRREAAADLRAGEQAEIWAAAHDTRILFDAHCLTLAGGSRLRLCTYGDRESPTTVVLFGDSHAEHWFPALDLIAQQKHWRLVTMLKASCPVARVDVYNPILKGTDTACSLWRERALTRIVTLKPYLVILSEKDGIVQSDDAPGPRKYRRAITAAYWEQGLRSTVSYLHSNGLRTVVIADVPRPPVDIPTCLSRAAAQVWASKDCIIRRETALNANARQAENAALMGIADVKLVDFADVLCSDSVCQSTLNGQVIYRDNNHLASDFARGLAPLLEKHIDSLLSSQTSN